MLRAKWMTRTGKETAKSAWKSIVPFSGNASINSTAISRIFSSKAMILLAENVRETSFR